MDSLHKLDIHTEISDDLKDSLIRDINTIIGRGDIIAIKTTSEKAQFIKSIINAGRIDLPIFIEIISHKIRFATLEMKTHIIHDIPSDTRAYTKCDIHSAYHQYSEMSHNCELAGDRLIAKWYTKIYAPPDIEKYLMIGPISSIKKKSVLDNKSKLKHLLWRHLVITNYPIIEIIYKTESIQHDYKTKRHHRDHISETIEIISNPTDIKRNNWLRQHCCGNITVIIA